MENGFRLKEGRYRLDIEKKFFSVRPVRHWNRLPRDMVNALPLETRKVRLGWAPLRALQELPSLGSIRSQPSL